MDISSKSDLPSESSQFQGEGAGSSTSRAPADNGARRRRYLWLAAAFLWAGLCTAFFCSWQSPYPNVDETLSGWKWWWFPREANTALRLPVIRTSKLTSVFFAPDGQRGCAVGFPDTLLSTGDGGRTWISQASGTNAWFLSLFFTADGRHGWAVGSDGTIISTSDVGKTWKQQASHTNARLVSVWMAADGLQGWVVGDGGTVLNTLDGGNTWNPNTSGTTFRENLISVFFAANGRNGWIVGHQGPVWGTFDGGKTWNEQYGAGTAYLESSFFSADGQRGWVVGSGVILSTPDGGKTWKEQKTPGDIWLKSVFFLTDGLHGWAAGNNGSVLSTNDGKIWNTQATAVDRGLESIFFCSDGRRGWAVTDGGTVLSTRDAGKTWIQQTREKEGWLGSVCFTAYGKHGWAVGPGRILKSDDGGKTWSLQTRADARSVSIAADGRRAWAVGSNGLILHTSDGGKTWDRQTSKTEMDLSSVFSSSDGQRAWAVGTRREILSTTDSGNRWIEQSFDMFGDQLDSVVFAADGQRGWALENGYSLHYTVDGGKNWNMQKIEGHSGLNALFFSADGNHGWAVGAKGLILTTSDGGKTWNQQQGAGEAQLASIFFCKDNQHGWIVGNGGVIISTADGGETWQPQTSHSDSDFSSVWFADDGRHGWAVESMDDGTIISTNDGGATWKTIRLYRCAPAPIYFLLLSLTLVPLRFAVRKAPDPRIESESIASVYISDAALSAEQAAGTQMGAVAAGLASYIENPRTQAPLVIGITGTWGSGKSSLMGVLRDHLRARGFQTAWFNAWHHQSEEHLFASLLASLRGKALPPWWRIRGLVVRWRLLRERCERMWLRLLLGLAGLVFICAVAPQLHLETGKVLEWKNLENLLRALTLPAALLPVLAAWKVFSAFGVEPAKLGELLRGPTAAKAGEAASLRQQFAEEFGEVTRALQPQALTLFIDDLDRCQPDQMFTMLEAINFLASSGACYIVLGMEQRVVLHFLDKKLKEENMPDPAGTTPGVTRAQLWLEKLVQLRLRVSALPSAEMKALYDSRAGKNANGQQGVETDWERFTTRLPRFFKATGKVLAILVLIGGVGFGAWWIGTKKVAPHLTQKPPETSEAKEPEKPPGWLSEMELTGKLNNTDVVLRAGPKATPTPKSPTDTAPTSRSPTDTAPTPTPSTGAGPAFVTAGQVAPLNWEGLIAAAAVMLLIGLGVRQVMSIRDLTMIEDSETFTETLNEFAPCIGAACKTPRAVKQLINRIRLYAMLLRHWTTSSDAAGAEQRLRGQEANIVIFGILEKLCPEQLREALKHPQRPGLRLELVEPEFAFAEFNDRANEAIRTLEGTLMREDFERLVRAIEMD